jgi:AcrR family transcriptional regulator
MSPRRAKAVSGRVDLDPATALREHLIDAAETLLSERQVAAITTRDIARAAGVSDGVLYNYFADKHDLLLTALTRRYGRVVTGFATDLPQPGVATVEQNLHAFVGALLDLHADALPIAAGLLTEPQLLRRFVDAIHTEPFGPHRILHPIGDYLTGEQRLGRLHVVDVDGAVALIFGSALMLALGVAMGQRSREDIDRDVPGVVHTLVRGLHPPGTPPSG